MQNDNYYAPTTPALIHSSDNKFRKRRSVTLSTEDMSSKIYPQSPTVCFSRIFIFRSLLIFSLAAAVAVCATVSYKLLNDAQEKTGFETFKSIANTLVSGALATAQRKAQVSIVLSTLWAELVPNAADWPFIEFDGYMSVSEKIAALSSSTTLATVVFVDPSQAAQFENHMKAQYIAQGRPEEAGYSDFGFGVWKPDPSAGFEDGRSHDISGNNTWNGTSDMLIPLAFHNQPAPSSLMYNVYSEEDRGIYVDSMMDCVERARLNRSSTELPACAVVTDMLTLKIMPGPAALLMQPIFPSNDNDTFVGFASTTLHWQQVLEKLVPDFIDGIHCVISTGSNSYTYEIRSGYPELLGDGDLHDRAYTSFAQSVLLDEAFKTEALSSARYNLTIYPTRRSLHAFSTSSPLAVSAGFFGAIFFVALVFGGYDYFMRHESEQRKAVLEMKRRFVRFISHEIRTPLNTVCMGIEMLQAELGRLNTENVENTQQSVTSKALQKNVDFWHSVTVDVHENAQIAVSILNDLLNYDKLETGTMKLETSIVPIWDLLERTVNQFKIQAVNRNVKLIFNVAGTAAGDVEAATSPNPTCNIIGDDMRLSQVLRNLISNALKFTCPDGTIEVSALHIPNGLPFAKPLALDSQKNEPGGHFPRAGSIRISVKDSGVGLSEEQLSLLFTEGVQFDANRLQHGGGSGLGLSIAKGIVEQHNGIIRAESEGIGYGTSFIVELPLFAFTKDELMSMKEDYDQKSMASSTTSSRNIMKSDDDLMDVAKRVRRVLVAEDAASSRKMLIRLLERAGHECFFACNGQEAVDIIKNDLVSIEKNPQTIPIDTVLMDFEMPLLTGPEATKALRDIGFKGKIFGITGNVLEEDIEFFKNQGADEVFAKPIRMEAINAFLSKSRKHETGVS